MKYFIVADVHGFYNEMRSALDNAGYDKSNPNHTFVSLGDLLDRGRQPKECIDFVLSIPKERRILIYGNHEDLMEMALARNAWNTYDYSNGTVYTAMYLTGEVNANTALMLMYHNDKYNAYIKECEFYHETNSYIFVHGWIPHESKVSRIPLGEIKNDHYYNSSWRNASVEEWRKALWYNGMESWAWDVKEPDKTICCGHWHTEWGNTHLHQELQPKYTPFIDEGIIALDACTMVSGFVNCYVVED